MAPSANVRAEVSAGDKARDAGDNDPAARRIGRSDADDEAGRRYQPVVGALNRSPQPASAGHHVALRVRCETAHLRPANCLR